MAHISENNYKWIYTYDYSPDSVWDEWREASDNSHWIEPEADAVVKRAFEHDGLPTFVLMTDSHFVYNGTWDDTVRSIETVSRRMDIRGIIHLGDLSDGLLPLRETMKIEDRCKKDLTGIGCPVYMVPGNHDYNYFRKNPEIKYPELPRYYIDYEEEKLRLIFIDSFDPRESVRYGFSDECIHFLDTALNEMPADYKAIILSHLTPLVRLQAWTKDIRNREKLINVLDSHADRVIAFINGHNHCDHLFNELNNGMFPIISINCAKCEYFTDHKPEGSVVPKRELGNRTQESFDIMQVDSVNSKIYFTRFGAGSDRVVENHKARWVSC